MEACRRVWRSHVCPNRGERTCRWTDHPVGPLTRPPKPTSAAPAECLQRAVRIEHLEADAGRRVDVVEASRTQCMEPPSVPEASSNNLGGWRFAQLVETDGDRREIIRALSTSLPRRSWRQGAKSIPGGAWTGPRLACAKTCASHIEPPKK